MDIAATVITCLTGAVVLGIAVYDQKANRQRARRRNTRDHIQGE